MTFQRLLVGLVDRCCRNAWRVVLIGGLLAAFAGWYAAGHLGISTDTDLMFSESLPWRQRALMFRADFPQYRDLLVAVIEAREPEEAEATAAALAEALSRDSAHFLTVRRPDALPFLKQQGLLFLDPHELEKVLDRTIDAQPFIGELAKDPDARGLFAALGLLGTGVEQGEVNLAPYLSALAGFHQAMADAIAGHPRPLSWTRLLGGELADLGGKYKFVLAQPRLDHTRLQPGGAATEAMRAVATGLEFVKSGDARVRITGSVALADEEFASVAEGAVAGMIGSILLISLWLYLAVRSWRLIVPILLTLGLGLMLTLLFAAAAVGTLNLVSVGFGILFVGIAVDFAIQFCVRYREYRHEHPAPATAMAETGRRVGGQILVAAAATSAGFLAFVPTDFRGVAELGLIAGIGMLIAFVCTVTFLPAAIGLFRPPGERAEVGFAWAAPLDELVRRQRRPLLIAFGLLGGLGAVLLPRLGFDADPLHTKNPRTEAMQTLYDLEDFAADQPVHHRHLGPRRASGGSASETTENPAACIGSLVDQQLRAGGSTGQTGPDPGCRRHLRPDPDPARAGRTRHPVRDPRGSPFGIGENRACSGEVAARPCTGGDCRRPPRAGRRSRSGPALGQSSAYALSADAARPVAHGARGAAGDVGVPSPELTRDWMLPDERARVQVIPKPEARSTSGLANFVDKVTTVAPDAGGSAVTIEATSATIVGSFRAAAISALLAITVILFAALRRPLDVLLVLAPLVLSSLMTVVIIVLLPLLLNYANIIALPLLLGVGVSFNIYFVMNWRAGQISVLGSATARAILFSALTTGTAFGSLALSGHPGTASMGTLLLISLGCTLVASLVFIPALLAAVPRPPRIAEPALADVPKSPGE